MSEDRKEERSACLCHLRKGIRKGCASGEYDALNDVSKSRE